MRKSYTFAGCKKPPLWGGLVRLYSHLGNNREVWLANNQTTIQKTNYYPSGLPWAYTAGDGAENQPYKYGGKEFVEFNGFDEFDFHARMFYPAIMRFNTVDPLAEKRPWLTGYHYCRNNPIRYTDPDGQWEWDATGNLVAQKGDNSYSMAKFLGTSQSNAMQMLNRGGVTVNSKGVLNLKEGQSFAKGSLWVGTKSASGSVVNNTTEAKAHYDNGSGTAADVGDQSTSQLLGSDKFQSKLTKITSEKVQVTGYFAVNMTDLPGSFHIGNTGVDYIVTNNGTSSAVTFTLFTNTNKNSTNRTDGFWDPNFVAEKSLGKIWDRYKADEMGPNLEWGGTPYPYKTRERTFFFKPVEEKNNLY